MTDSRTCIYLRKSRSDTEAETEEETLARHKASAIAYCEQHDLQVVDIVEELQSGGDDLAERPKLIKFLQNVQSGAYTDIVIVKFDRLGRNTQTLNVVLDIFKTSEVVVHQVEGGLLDTQSANGNVVNSLLSALAVSEYETIKDRCRAGKERSVDNGEYIGSIAPYGYKKISTRDKNTGKYTRSLEIVEEEAKVVREVYRLRAEGKTIDSITDWLNSEGIPCRSGGLFVHKVVADMLRNPHYIGMVKYGYKRVKRQTRVDAEGNSSSKRRRIKQEKYKLVQGKHEAIIDKETWQKVQSIPVPSRVGERHAQNILAGGIMRCSMCGASYYFSEQGKKRYPVYVHTRTSKPCEARGRSFSAINFFKAMCEQMRSDLADVDVEAEYTLASAEEKEAELEKAKKEKKKLETEKKKIVKACNRLYIECEDAEQRKDLLTEYGEDMKRIDKKIASYEEKIARLENALNSESVKSLQINLQEAISIVEDWQNNKEEARAFLIGVIAKIEITLKNRHVAFKLFYKQ